MNRKMYKEIANPILNKIDSETMHIGAREALHKKSNPVTLKLLELFADQHKRFVDPRLNIVLAGIYFENPVMVGPGWDKPGGSEKALYALGFSGVEVGGVLPEYQSGNKKPRQFMISEDVAINHLGLNGLGVKKVIERIKKYERAKERKNLRIGINVGQNNTTEPKDSPAAFATVVRETYPYADYFTLNPLCPNVENHDIPMEDVIEEVNATMDSLGGIKPVFIKEGPDSLDQADRDIRLVKDYKLAGIVATNTTTDTEIKAKYGKRWQNQPGGLSGNDPDFRKRSTKLIAHIRKQTHGEISIIGAGGVHDWETALEKIEAGAQVIQIVTAIRGEGPAIAGKINRGLAEFMNREGIKNIGELVGFAA